MRLRHAWSHAAGCFFCLLGMASAQPAPAPDLDLEIGSFTDTAESSLGVLLASGPAIVMFWRADCAPCLEELVTLDGLRAAAAPLRVLLVGLDTPVRLRPALEQLGIDAGEAWHASGDPARILTDFGGYPPRLPLSVAFDGEGRLCARRTGMLGPGLAEEWRVLCR